MMDQIQNIVADRQYQGALETQNATLRPLEPFPTPSLEEYEYFRSSHESQLKLSSLLDSPIGVYCLKEFCASTSANYESIIDFLIQFSRMKSIENPDVRAAEELFEISTNLPEKFQKDVEDIRNRILSLDPDQREQDFPNLANTQQTPGSPGMSKTSTKQLNMSPRSEEHNSYRQSLNLVSFGGMNVNQFNNVTATHQNFSNKQNVHNGQNEVLSGVDVEVVAEDETNEKNDKEVIKRQQLVMRRSQMKRNALYLFGDLAVTLERTALAMLEKFQHSENYRQMINALWFSEKQLTVKDFVLFRDLGRGAFGVVSSAKTKCTGTLTAIKCLSKRLVKAKKAKKLVEVEKKILQTLGDNPSSFTVWLKYAFQDKEYFYMALPLCTGGDLGFHLKRKGVFHVDRVRFHAAEILEGLVHLHSLSIIYRDLKPENCIVDLDGHVRISDMGLATITGGKRIRGRAGTPGYWSPEVIGRQHYSYSTDFWSLGCVIFEMLVGLCPFSSTNTGMERDEATLYWNVVFPQFLPKPNVKNPNEIKQMAFPAEAKSLLLGLLDRNRNTRFDESDMKSHPFFASIDWQALAAGELPAVWKPKQGKIHALDAVELDYANTDNQYRKVRLIPEDEITGFDYMSKYAHQVDIVNVLRTQAEGKLVYENNFEPGCGCCPM